MFQGYIDSEEFITLKGRRKKTVRVSGCQLTEGTQPCSAADGGAGRPQRSTLGRALLLAGRSAIGSQNPDRGITEPRDPRHRAAPNIPCEATLSQWWRAARAVWPGGH